MASIFSVRPLSGAPVSMSVTWDELKEGEDKSQTVYDSNLATNYKKERAGMFQNILHERFNINDLVAKL